MSNNEYIEKLKELVSRSGWTKGFQAFLHSLPSELFYYYFYSTREKIAAWKYLLDLTPDKSVLVIEGNFGGIAFSLADNCRHVVTAQYNRSALFCVKKRAEEAGKHNISHVCCLLDGSLSFKADSFDAVIIFANGLSGELELPGLLESSYYLLKDDGYICLASNNHDYYRYKIPKKSLPFSNRLLAYTKTATLLEQINFRNIQGWVSKYELTALSKITPLLTYLPSKNSAKEKLRSFLLHSPLKDLIISSFVMLGFKENMPVSFVEALLAEISKTFQGKKFILLSYFIGNPAVVILILGENRDAPPMVVIRLPMTEEALARCRNNGYALSILQQKAGNIASKAPRLLAHGRIWSQLYFVETFMNGMVVDSPNQPFEQIIGNASDFILELHKKTVRPTLVTKELFDRLFMPFFNKLGTVPGTAGNLDLVFEFLRMSFENHEIPLVFMHGDYKPENIIVSPETLEVTGIIDWDLAAENGLPLIDLCFLLLYKYKIIKNTEFHNVFIEKFIDNKLDAQESELIDKYMVELGIKKDYMFPLVIAFWLHHLASRISTTQLLQKEWTDKNLVSVLGIICKIINN